MVKLLGVVFTVLYASASALGAPMPYSAAAVEQMRAQGISEHEIATQLGSMRPSPAYMEAEVPHPRLRPHQRVVRDRSGDVVPAPRGRKTDEARAEMTSSLTQSISKFINRFLKSNSSSGSEAAKDAAQQRAERNRRSLSWVVGKGRKA